MSHHPGKCVPPNQAKARNNETEYGLPGKLTEEAKCPALPE